MRSWRQGAHFVTNGALAVALFVTLAVASLAHAQDVPLPPTYADRARVDTIERVADDAPGVRVTLAEGASPATLWYAPRERMAAALASRDLAPFGAACLAPCTLSVPPDDYVLAIAPPEGPLATFPLARRSVHIEADAVLHVGVISHQPNRDTGVGLMLGGLGAFLLGCAIGLPLFGIREGEAGASIAAVGALTGVVLAVVGLVFAFDLDEGVVWVS